MGSPMVFQTAPPQPASNARMTCSPQLVGGPEASQNGFGLRMPANFVERSATRGPQDGQRGAFTIRDRIDYFAAAVGAVTAAEIFLVIDAGGEGPGARLAERRH